MLLSLQNTEFKQLSVVCSFHIHILDFKLIIFRENFLPFKEDFSQPAVVYEYCNSKSVSAHWQCTNSHFLLSLLSPWYPSICNDSLWTFRLKISPHSHLTWKQCVVGHWATILQGHIMHPRMRLARSLSHHPWDNESGERFCFTSEDSQCSWQGCRYFQLLPLLACRQKGSYRLRHEPNRRQLYFS